MILGDALLTYLRISYYLHSARSSTRRGIQTCAHQTSSDRYIDPFFFYKNCRALERTCWLLAEKESKDIHLGVSTHLQSSGLGIFMVVSNILPKQWPLGAPYTIHQFLHYVLQFRYVWRLFWKLHLKHCSLLPFND